MEKVVKKKVEWYNEASTVTTLLIGLIVVIVLLSQSFAIKNGLSTSEILSSILSHNSVYLFVCLYFIALKTKFGKKNFDYLNIFLILFYIFTTFTSFLTVFQSFNLNNLMSLFIHVFIVLYLIHTFLRGTRLWKEFKLSKSPFNEFSNDGYFYTVVILGVILLAINLIMTTSFHGTVLALLDCLFTYLFARYIYLYWIFLDEKKIDAKNNGNFDKIVETVTEEVKETIEDVKESFEKVSEKIEEPVEKISEAVVKVNDKVEEFTEVVKEKVEDAKEVVEEIIEDMSFEENNNTEEKIEVVEKVEGNFKEVKEENKPKKNGVSKKNKEVKKEHKNYKGVSKKKNVTTNKKKVTK